MLNFLLQYAAFRYVFSVVLVVNDSVLCKDSIVVVVIVVVVVNATQDFLKVSLDKRFAVCGV